MAEPQKDIKRAGHGDERPTKRIRTDNGGDGQSSEKTGRKNKGGKWRPQTSNSTPRTASKGFTEFSTAGIQSGDVGIFVSCDRGCERKSLRELNDLVLQELRDNDKSESNETSTNDTPSKHNPDETQSQNNDKTEVDIEIEIQAELNSLRPYTQPQTNSNPDFPSAQTSKTKTTLILLDIPCVSFLKLSPEIDPVKLVLNLCETAYQTPTRQKSRFILRLTPISATRKTLNNGIETLCDMILPGEFQTEITHKFAIRPTIRSNNQIGRTEAIDLIAQKVTDLGKHKVDLTGYEKLVLVDVYKNICGMAVVGGEFERLKRFNLAEIYAAGRVDKSGVEKKEEVEVEAVEKGGVDE